MTAPSWLTARPIAHRGLHDLAADRPENTLGAFRAAVEGGYAIECDLQPSRDGEAMVFHDFELDRLTAERGKVAERDAASLAAMRVMDTDERIPTLGAMLELVADRVPIVLELKGPQTDAEAFVAAVARACDGYDGRVAVMSFDHDLVRLFRTALPDRPRGLTAMGDDRSADTHAAIFEEADLQFVSYHVDDLPNPFVADVRAAGSPAITWTVRAPGQVATTREHADQMTFEGFAPATVAKNAC